MDVANLVIRGDILTNHQNEPPSIHDFLREDDGYKISK